MRGSISVKGRWDYPHNSPRKKYSKKYYYWFLRCTDEHTGDVITVGINYKELGEVLGDIIEHEVNYYTKTLGIEEALKRREQLYKAMSVPIERRIHDNKNKDRDNSGC